MVRRRADGRRPKATVRRFTADMQSQWHLMPKDVLSRVLAHSSSLSCIARQVCKAWRQTSISCPVALDISLASFHEHKNLRMWLHSHEAKSAPADTDNPTGDLSSCSDNDISSQHVSDETTSTHQPSSQASLADAHTLPIHEHKGLAVPNRQKKPPQELVQHISSLKLHVWLDLSRREEMMVESTQTLLAVTKFAHVAELTLGEFLSSVFCRVGFLQSLQPPPPASSQLQSLTLHLDTDASSDLFIMSCLGVLPHLTVLKSLTVKVREIGLEGERKTQHVAASQLLPRLPNSLQSVSLQNFRARWHSFGDLSVKSNLVSLDLTKSSCIFPADPQAWTQLQHLKLTGSAVWLQQGQPFLFSALTRLTQLDLKDCAFASFAPGQHGNTHHYVYRQLQVPASIVSLNISTRSVQCLLVRERLTALTSLWLHSACEVMDDKAPLQSNPHLHVTFDTLNKGYHGQWWDQLKRLYTKCPCNVALGNAGPFPEGLEVLRLHTYRPEPVSVSTDEVTHRPKVYPHQAVPGPQLPDQASRTRRGTLARGSNATNNAAPNSKKGRPVKLRTAASCSVLPCLLTLELSFTGSLRELTLTGLPKLQHLRLTQQLPRSEPKVTVQCKALRLPLGLLSFHLTISTPSLDISKQLTCLCRLPWLETVGLHGPLHDQIPALPATLTSLDLSNTWLVDRRSYSQLSLMTHLRELVLPHPLPSADPQAQALQRQLKMHHVRLRYNDPRMPSTVDTCGPLATDSALPGQAAVPGLNPLDTSEALSLAYHMAHEYRI